MNIPATGPGRPARDPGQGTGFGTGAGAGRAAASGSEAELELPFELITGEAVALDLRPASFATRLLALSLDLLIMFAALVLAGFTLAAVLNDVDDAAATALSLTAYVGILVGLPVGVESLSRGRSAGKVAAGLRVVRDDGGPIRFRHALIRGLLAVFEIYLTGGSVALIASLSSRQGKRIGDSLAGTYVVRARGGRPLPPPIPMPPDLALWAGSADIGRIPDRIALAARQFLARSTALHPSSRQRLGVGLADQIARYVAPPPPAGVHPERFLAAVLAERRRRDLDRLARETHARQARSLRRAQASPLSPTSTRLLGE